MAAERRRTSRRSPAHTDVITYRLDDQMIYVPLSLSWSKALKQAQHSFESLAHVDERQITFSVNVVNDGKRRSVRISPPAWQSIASNLAQYEIIDIVVLSTPDVVVTDVDAPPRYSSPDVSSSLSSSPETFTSEKEKEGSGRRSPSPLSQSAVKLNPKRVFQKICSTISNDRDLS